MTVVDVLLIITALGLIAAGVAITLAQLRQIGSGGGESPRSAEPNTALHAEVARLHAEVRELRQRPKPQRSVFMEMADAINHMSQRPTYDEARLDVPVMDLALGKKIKFRLLSGNEATFTLPAKTKSGTKFRFRGGGENGRDLYVEVRALITTETT